ncbi:FtsX-like permease family protein [Actinoplanes sp. GCM10030250]|uniref:FtsX-like permease family protein n=1 Tax=Actinoplanes sp. GCM10030250 TaxID=3273376 RepID=UPI00361DBDF4
MVQAVLGAPARDRRLAALRLNGATPRQAVLIGGVETAVTSVLGSLGGFGIHLLLRRSLEMRDAQNRLLLPTDVLPHPIVIAGTLALAVRSQFRTDFAAHTRYNELTGSQGYGTAEDPDFYLGAVNLIMVAVAVAVVIAAAGLLVALAESIVARRRTHAALTAAGVPRRTLSAAVLGQTFAPLVPALLLAIGSGVALSRSLITDVEVGGGSIGESCAGEPATCANVVVDPLVVMPVPVPVRELLLLGSGAAVIMVGVAGIGLLVLRSSTDLEELRVG